MAFSHLCDPLGGAIGSQLRAGTGSPLSGSPSPNHLEGSGEGSGEGGNPTTVSCFSQQAADRHHLPCPPHLEDRKLEGKPHGTAFCLSFINNTPLFTLGNV
ncbi:unnamed protein product [Rangifer tarandus platyrhynchus]|uniref:Uncharacterized protein n=1 Tax=Rangifer tarandus platyrhynchus TaxID=3082113 RepID=A0AC60A1Q9_RANTA